MDIISYALSSGLSESLSSGIVSYSVDGLTLNINCRDGKVLSMTFPKPADGASIKGVFINRDGELICELSNGETIPGGKVPVTAGVESFNGRAGIVIPEAGDYTNDMVGADPAGSSDTALTNANKYTDGQVEILKNRIDDEKQNKLTGTKGQVVGFDDNGEPVAVTMDGKMEEITDSDLSAIIDKLFS
jgi:hypothetical protein